MFKKGSKKGLSRGREFIGGCEMFFNCGTGKFEVGSVARVLVSPLLF